MTPGKPRPLDCPIEKDCACGTHHVIDPEEVNRILGARRYRCGYCRRRLRPATIAGFVSLGNGVLRGVCANCARESGHSEHGDLGMIVIAEGRTVG